jgi:hypothetical protein
MPRMPHDASGLWLLYDPQGAVGGVAGWYTKSFCCCFGNGVQSPCKADGGGDTCPSLALRVLGGLGIAGGLFCCSMAHCT